MIYDANKKALIHSISDLQDYVCLLTALEALFVPFQSTGNPLFCSVNGFATFRAFWMFHRLERHFYTTTEKTISLLPVYDLLRLLIICSMSNYSSLIVRSQEIISVSIILIDVA